ncbi:glycoside hydrolase [Penicillium capsulatum]|uniref:Probable glucan endo-1,3-beta-glucosidase eglC n=1 Tax=Penicillium capsulatum TaxID=69766 RepID=A0A9W9IBU5_9EURO|nr:glycoside hydrolase [Penicillium capsulatum]KAJ6135496.1 glycoside hydrolase [Penicillium capsulatum]
MHMKSQLLALALSVATAEAAHKGFNYGATNTDGSTRSQADFKAQFSAAKGLEGATDFTSARLYTMIQGGTTNTPIEAIPAAIEENTSLLLGLWASGGGIDNEIAALKAAIDQYGEKFAKLVVGISVGSEDLYRNSVIGSKSNAGPGVEPDVLVEHIKSVRSAIAGTSLSKASIGHVDTWDCWTNDTNSAVVKELDWVGFDGYPYFQNSMDNSIDDAKALFDDAVEKTKSAAGGKEVWITETGWPVSGKQENKAVASPENAKKFWDQVGCPLFGNTNTWWYILQDVGASPSFGLVGENLTGKPLFDLKCPSSNSPSSSSTGKVSRSGDSVSSASGSGSASSSVSASASASASASTSASAGPFISAAPSSSGFASKMVVASGQSSARASASGSATSKASTRAASTPLSTSTKAAGSGSGSGSSSNGGSGSSSSNGSPSGSGSAASASSSLPANGADRPAGSIFGAVAAVLALAIAV